MVNKEGTGIRLDSLCLGLGLQPADAQCADEIKLPIRLFANDSEGSLLQHPKSLEMDSANLYGQESKLSHLLKVTHCELCHTDSPLHILAASVIRSLY